MNPTVVGIDVGGEQKGFHAVVLHDGKFLDKTANRDPAAIVDWCLDHNARVVAVDAPCRWSRYGSSRLAERELNQQGIRCFYTPTRERALHRAFYEWVFNGEKLYRCLVAAYALFNGKLNDETMCIETFPHAIVCALAGRVVSAKPKATVRRAALLGRGYDISDLPNIDFVDAALCAVTADAFHNDSYKRYGARDEGFIVVPSILSSIY